MELVYLWVEDYKIIEKQEFNFSPRFNCHYNNQILTIKENIDEKGNKQYIENFFGDNINVTAIVGKNGSGKSNLLKSFADGDFKYDKVYYIYSKTEKRQLYSNYFKQDKDKNGISIEKKDFQPDDIIYMNKFFFMDKYENYLFASNLLRDSNLYFNKFKTPKNKQLSSENFHKNILELIFKKKYLPFSKIFEPKEILISFNRVNKKLKFSPNEEKEVNECSEILVDYKYLYKIYLKSLEVLKPYKNKPLDKNDRNIVIATLISFIHKREKILEDDYKMIDYLDVEDKRVFNFLEKFTSKDKIKISNFYEEYLKYNDDKSYYDIFYYLYKIGFLEYEIYDGDKTFSSLSSGEKSLFSDFILLNEKFDDEKKDSKPPIHKIILLDEPDLTLHPEWQKQYIDTIVSFLSFEKFKSIKFHLIITTHSPFLLSDIPKDNIIFLDSYDEKSKEKYPNLRFDSFKDGNCINVTNEINIKPFGANIHNLLAHGFFMEDGLMGEFALKKIQLVVDFYNDVKNSKKKQEDYNEVKNEFYFIRDNIGEEYIKGVITNHIEFIEEKLGDKDFKEKRIKQLKKELNELGAKYDTD